MFDSTVDSTAPAPSLQAALNQFSARLQKLEDVPAFCIADTFHSYKTLAETVSKIRTAIQATGCPGKQLGLVANDDLETYASIFALWLEGRAYMPLHPQQPAERNLALIAQADIELIIDSSTATTFPEIATIRSSTLEFDQLNLFPDRQPEHALAYLLFTSGSTGKPKGVLHTTGGYLLQAAMTFKYVLDYRDGEVFWCTADVGWVTGHSYIVYGPLANGATSLMFEGVPVYPSSSRFWQVIDKHQVNIFYTAPTALRALMREGHAPLENTSRASLRLLGSVGEPINPEAWDWYFNAVGEQRCPIVDTWWQTETGGIMLSPLVSAQRIKPGCATQPMFGVLPVLLDEHGKEINGPGSGVLAIKSSWPGQIRSVYGDPQRMIDTYFKPYPGYYFTGDGARRDEDGDYWITGRIDDVINVSGHRIGTAEVESALVLHDWVAEAAVVGYPHDIKGQAIYAFVTPMNGVEPSDTLKKHLLELVSKEIGSFAKPELIQWAPALPKTRSGKIMRRILRKIACNELDSLGDTSTLADPSVVAGLIDKRLNR
jgi:acetyl-CoA synthetase